jgi:hypothetical protein
MVNLGRREIKLFYYLAILFWMVVYVQSDGGTQRQMFSGGHQHFRANRCLYLQSNLET